MKQCQKGVRFMYLRANIIFRDLNAKIMWTLVESLVLSAQHSCLNIQNIGTFLASKLIYKHNTVDQSQCKSVKANDTDNSNLGPVLEIS